MRRILAVAIVLGLAGAALLLAPRRTAAQRAGRFDRESVNGRDVVAREVLVKFRQRPLPSDLAQVRDRWRCRRRAVNWTRRRVSDPFAMRSAAALAAMLARRPDVVYAEPNFVVKIISEPNDPRFPELWALKNIGQVIAGSPGVPGADIHTVPAWSISLGSTLNVVGVIDTGIDYTHPDLAANMWSAPTAYTVIHRRQSGDLTRQGRTDSTPSRETCDPMDDQDHGTHVAGDDWRDRRQRNRRRRHQLDHAADGHQVHRCDRRRDDRQRDPRRWSLQPRSNNTSPRPAQPTFACCRTAGADLIFRRRCSTK